MRRAPGPSLITGHEYTKDLVLGAGVGLCTDVRLSLNTDVEHRVLAFLASGLTFVYQQSPILGQSNSVSISPALKYSHGVERPVISFSTILFSSGVGLILLHAARPGILGHPLQVKHDPDYKTHDSPSTELTGIDPLASRRYRRRLFVVLVLAICFRVQIIRDILNNRQCAASNIEVVPRDSRAYIDADMCQGFPSISISYSRLLVQATSESRQWFSCQRNDSQILCPKSLLRGMAPSLASSSSEYYLCPCSLLSSIPSIYLYLSYIQSQSIYNSIQPVAWPFT